MTPSDVPIDSSDPVLVARARWSALAGVGRKVGGSCYLGALALFMIAVVMSYPASLIQSVTVLLIVGSVILGPAIVLGYMVRAAHQDDPVTNPAESLQQPGDV